MYALSYEAVAGGGAGAAAGRGCRARPAQLLVVAPLVAAGGLAARRWRAGGQLWSRHPEGLIRKEAVDPQCAEPEVDVDYWTTTNLAVLENVSTSEHCLRRCTAERQCGAWTWGAPGGTPDSWQLQKVCFLKPTGLSVDKHPKAGVISGLPCRSDQDEEVAHEGVFQAIRDCHHAEEGVDLLGSELGSLALPPVEGVPSEGACRAACEDEPRCGAWTWGKARNTRWLTDVCFLKEASSLGQLVWLNKTGVVSGLPCRGPQASPAAPSAVSGTGEGEEIEVLTDCREQDPNIDYWTLKNMRVLEDVNGTAACSDECQAEPECGAWTWGSPTSPQELHRGRCYLKGLEPKPQRVREEGLISGVPCRPTPAAAQPQLEPAEGSAAAPVGPLTPAVAEEVQHRHPEECHDPEVDVDYMAKDLSSEQGVGSAEECRRRCAQVTDCDFWMWGKVRGWVGLSDVCFFKSATPGVVAQRYQKYGVVSGVPCRSVPPEPAEAAPEDAAADAEKAACLPSESDVDYVSKENLRERTGVESAEACRALCEHEPRCGAWTWGTESGPSAMAGVCFLKPPDPQTWRNPQAGVVSGQPCRSAKASRTSHRQRLQR